MHEIDVANDLVPDLISGWAVCAACVATGETDDKVAPFCRALQGRHLRACAQVAQTCARDDLIPNGIMRIVASGCGVENTLAAEPVVSEEDPLIDHLVYIIRPFSEGK